MKPSESLDQTRRRLSNMIVAVDKARHLAHFAHVDQFDKNNEPVIEHAARVARSVPLPIEPAAWLHDVVEDSPITLEDLHRFGFTVRVCNAVRDLTRTSGVTYEGYIEAMAGNPDAVIIKIADLKDHLDPVRIHAISDSLRKRYEQALAYLESLAFGEPA